MPSKLSTTTTPRVPAKVAPAAFGATHHREQQRWAGAEPFLAGGPSPRTENLCGPGEAYCPDVVCWRAPSHERGHDRVVLCPSLNHPCCTFASSSDSSARGASHGNACHASRSSESCAGHSVCGPGTTHRSSSPGTSFCDPLLSSPLLAAWKRQKVPIVASCGITPLVVTPLRHWGYARCAKYFPSYC